MNDDLTRLNEGLSGRYVIERELGHGGMAQVYLARDIRYSRVVAIKVLKRELAQAIDDKKKYVLYEGSHFVPRTQLIAESLSWLDKHLGPVR